MCVRSNVVGGKRGRLLVLVVFLVKDLIKRWPVYGVVDEKEPRILQDVEEEET